VTQSAFAAALFQPDAPVPAGIVDPAGRVSNKRFNVYRNNVVASLSTALSVGFPVIAKLVGDDFFGAMAKVYLRRHPPLSPVMARYGAAFPVFLEHFAPVAHLTYLPDVARLELLLRESYHAADHTPLDPAFLGSVPPQDLGALCLRLAPSARLMRSAFPVAAIWVRNTSDPDSPLPHGGQDVLVVRPGFDPVPIPLPSGSFEFFTALNAGAPLEAAAGAASAATHDFDPTAALQLAFANSLFIAPEPAQAPEAP
jgi:hypothetical protein